MSITTVDTIKMSAIADANKNNIEINLRCKLIKLKCKQWKLSKVRIIKITQQIIKWINLKTINLRWTKMNEFKTKGN